MGGMTNARLRDPSATFDPRRFITRVKISQSRDVIAHLRDVLYNFIFYRLTLPALAFSDPAFDEMQKMGLRENERDGKKRRLRNCAYF